MPQLPPDPKLKGQKRCLLGKIQNPLVQILALQEAVLLELALPSQSQAWVEPAAQHSILLSLPGPPQGCQGLETLRNERAVGQRS